MPVRLKQLAQDGATDGQGLVYNASSGLWVPSDLAAGGGPDEETPLVENTRSEIGVTWTDVTSLTISTTGVYELEVSGVVVSDSAATGSVQLRCLKGAVPLAGHGLNRDGDGIFFDVLPTVAWGALPFIHRLLVYVTGSSTFNLQRRNSDGSTYHGVGNAKIQARRLSDLEAVDAISTMTMRLHAERANYAYTGGTGPLDWWSDRITGYTWLDGIHGGGEYVVDGYAAGQDSVEVTGVSGGWVGNVPGHSSTDHSFLFVLIPNVATGAFRNILRHTTGGSELGFLQSHTGDELAYIYGHAGSPQLLGVAGTTAAQFLGVVFDKTGADEVRVYRNNVEIASASLSGQPGQTFSATNQGWFSFPSSSGFACVADVREVFAFSNAIDTVTEDWNALNSYVSTTYSLF